MFVYMPNLLFVSVPLHSGADIKAAGRQLAHIHIPVS